MENLKNLLKDFKNILILILLFGCLTFGYIWFFGNGKSYRINIKQLEKEKKELMNERLLLHNKLDSLNKVNENLIKIDNDLSIKIFKRDEEIKKLKQSSLQTSIELNKMKISIKETQNKINELKKNPIYRTGDDLINSLKLKTK